MNPQHDPLDPQERALARLLAESPPGEPSPRLDARILAAAREAARPGAPGHARAPTRRRPRWPLVLGLAASVTLAVGVAWQLREPPRPPLEQAPRPAVSEAAPSPPSPSGADAAAGTPTTSPPAPQAITSDARAKPGVASIDAAAEHQAAVAAATERAAQRQQQAAGQAEAQAVAEAEQERAHGAAVAAAVQRSAQRNEKAARQAAAAPPATAVDVAGPRLADGYQAPSPPAPPAPASVPPPAPVADIAARVEAAPAANDSPRVQAPAAAEPPIAAASATHPLPPLSAGDAATLEADARLPPEQWLQRIRGHRDRGETALVRASLARFVRAHPDQAVPGDLQPFVPESRP